MKEYFINDKKCNEKQKILTAKFIIRPTPGRKVIKKPPHRSNCRCFECLLKDLYAYYFKSLKTKLKNGKNNLEAQCCFLTLNPHPLCLTKKQILAQKRAREFGERQIRNYYKKTLINIKRDLHSATCRRTTHFAVPPNKCLVKPSSKNKTIEELKCPPDFRTFLTADCKRYAALVHTNPMLDKVRLSKQHKNERAALRKAAKLKK